ncbi:Uncharacterised protein [Klebsiella pneumoniae]|nr:Uncharacterised protein [Klebsiella pneumoniae]
MNISTVNELIQSLESAGELSIRERKYLELAKAYQQLAAENVGIKQSKPSLKAMMSALDAFYADEDVPESAMLIAFNILRGDIETPATDAYLAGIKADGVEEFIGLLQQHVDEGDFVGDEVAVIVGAIDCGKEFFEQLREGADK